MAKEHDAAKGSLSKHDEPSGMHEVHVRKLHHGYHVVKHHPDGSQTEHAADSLEDAHDMLHDHMMEAEQAMQPQQPMDQGQVAQPGPPDQEMQGNG